MFCQVLSQCGPESAAVASWPVIGQFSSIGSLGASADGWLHGEWLNSLSEVHYVKTLLTTSAKPPLQLVCCILFSLLFVLHIYLHIHLGTC